MEGGKPENPEKNPRSKDENQQQTQPTYDAGTGIDLGSHWWVASAFTTAPSLLSPKDLKVITWLSCRKCRNVFLIRIEMNFYFFSDHWLAIGSMVPIRRKWFPLLLVGFFTSFTLAFYFVFEERVTSFSRRRFVEMLPTIPSQENGKLDSHSLGKSALSWGCWKLAIARYIAKT